MNWVDLSILIVLALFALHSQKNGFFNGIINIFGLFFSLIGSLYFYPNVAIFITKFVTLPKIALVPVAFLVSWIILETVFSILTTLFAVRLLGKFLNTPVNKILGFLPGIFNGLLFAAFFLLFVVSLPLSPMVKKDIFDSKIGSVLVEKATVLEKPFNNIFGPIAKQSLTFLTIKPEEKGTVKLGYIQTEVTIDAEGEQKIFDLVNSERVKAGVAPLVWDTSRRDVGRAHSKDMFARGYFSHYSPEGKDVGNRLEESKIAYTIAGENLALAPDINRAHSGLMASPGHKRNILDPAFKKIGIGVIDGGIYGKMVTQVFTD